MSNKRIFLSDIDYEKLSRLLNNLKSTHRLNTQHLIQLAEEMKNALVFDQEIIPQKYVTLYSRVTYINLKTKTENQATIVFPVDREETLNRYSILSPIGTALIGEEEQNTTTCYAPGGEIQIKIIKVEKTESIRD